MHAHSKTRTIFQKHSRNTLLFYHLTVPRINTTGYRYTGIQLTIYTLPLHLWADKFS